MTDEIIASELAHADLKADLMEHCSGFGKLVSVEILSVEGSLVEFSQSREVIAAANAFLITGKSHVTCFIGQLLPMERSLGNLMC